MTGVDILVMEKVSVNFQHNWNAFWFAAGIVFAIFVIYAIMSDLFLDEKVLVVIFGVLASIMIGILTSAMCGEFVGQETQYKVTISDEVSMNDFLERYEIIEQEGKIFTVRERVDDNDGE